MAVTCRCHASSLYAGLWDCPRCHHKSLDRVGAWEGCERRACGYEQTKATAWVVTVDTGWANFGFVVREGVVAECAPLTAWARGRSGREVVAYWRGRGAEVTWQTAS